jgi:hypothetical protein
MADLEQVRNETRAALGLGDDADLSYITEELVAEYEGVSGEGRIVVVKEDGSPASESDIGESTESTATYYGNHPMRLGTCLYWKTSGVGGPCGSSFTGKACNWRSASQTQVSWCSTYPGYRFGFSY